MAKIASRVMAGESLASFGLTEKTLDHIAVKEAVFPFARFPGVDTILGPEMRSTGEVMGLDHRLWHSVCQVSDRQPVSAYPRPRYRICVHAGRPDKEGVVEAVRRALKTAGFAIIATGGTQKYLEDQGHYSEENQQGA